MEAKRNWTVHARGRVFTMGSPEAINYAEALHAVRCIFGKGEVE